MVFAAIGTRSVAAGASIGAVFGVIRGGSLLLARRVRSTHELQRFHRSLAANAPRSQRIGVATQGLISVLSVVAVAGVR